MAERLPRLVPERLTDAQRSVYDAVVSARRVHGDSPFELLDADGSLVGPFNAMVTAPAVGAALSALGASLRFRTSLPPRARELAILLVAAHERSSFEWTSHVAAGRAAGLADRDFQAIRDGAPLWTDGPEALVVATTRQLLDAGNLTDAEFAAAADGLGHVGLVELLCLVGYYQLLAQLMRVCGSD